MKALIYCRTSGEDTNDNLENQEHACRQYCQEQGYEIAFVLKEDERGVSGKRLDAPMFLKAQDLAKQGAYDVFVVREISRLARKSFKLGLFKYTMAKLGIRIEYVKQSFDDNAYGRFSENILADIAELEADIIAQRLLDGRMNTVRKGSVVACGRTPYGLTTGEYLDGKGETKTTLVADDYAYVIRDIFRLYVKEHRSKRSIAIELTEKKIPTWSDLHQARTGKVSKKRKSQPCLWRPTQISKILKNPVYKGEWSLADYTVQITPIISPELWQLAQKEDSKHRKQTRKESPYLLTGMLRCECGSSMTGQTVHIHNREYRYYRCRAEANKFESGRDCHQRQRRCEDVELVLWHTLLEWFKNPKELERIVREQELEGESQRAKELARVADIDATIANLKAEFQAHYTTFTNPSVPQMAKDMALEQMNRLEKAIQDGQDERARVATLDDTPSADTIIERLGFLLQEVGGTMFIVDKAIGETEKEKAEEQERLRKALQDLGTQITISLDGTISLTCYIGEKDFTLSDTPTNGDAQFGKKPFSYTLNLGKLAA